MSDPVSLATAGTWIQAARHVVALTGAGMSTASGIPDFRGPNGVWTRNPGAEKLSQLSHYMSDPAIRVESWQQRLNHPAWQARPNPAHLALAELERRGHLQCLVTQNIDGLHRDAGNAARGTIEIHGTLREVVCMACGERAPMERALERVRAGEADPPCRTCGGILKSATISFGQSLVAEDLERAQEEAARSDLFLAIGTSLAVYPAAALPAVALKAGARLMILNAEPTPYDGAAAAVFREPLAEVLPALVAQVVGVA
ncbi:MAG: NAD-dependent protein deacetylase [Candidatus Dormibacteria bacterium]